MKISDAVVITGASAGVGRATAWAFAKRGTRIGLLALKDWLHTPGVGPRYRVQWW